MYHCGGSITLSGFTESVSVLISTHIAATSITFSPVKIIGLMVWFYLCMWSMTRIEYSPLVPNRYKPISNLLSLVIGPLLLFGLIAVDTARKIQRGELTLSQIWDNMIEAAFGKRTLHQRHVVEKIELLDSSGRSFFEVYGSQARGNLGSNDILKLTENIIYDAVQKKASDVLIDPKSNDVFTVRFRIDGFLRTTGQFEAEKCAAIINSIKAISGMDIAERRRPQDGAFMAKVAEGNIFFRVASAGVLGGEKLSIRVLNQTDGMLSLNDIGLSEKSHRFVANAVAQPSGMILVCGPTGSGKTTTLYAMLDSIDFLSRNVVTVEDPIEYVLPNASQIEVNVKADITFANTLRSILRQDPDVICVGEIRDSETAGMALQASQTGHLVLATLHSNSNMGALVRLMDLGIAPLLLASALSAIVSQRLLRRLCDDCKTHADLTAEQIAEFTRKGIDHRAIMKAVGCRECDGLGYKGRTAIIDVLMIDDEIKTQLINSTVSIGEMKNIGDHQGRSKLTKEGLKKVLLGLTTFDEVKRVTTTLG